MSYEEYYLIKNKNKNKYSFIHYIGVADVYIYKYVYEKGYFSLYNMNMYIYTDNE